MSKWLLRRRAWQVFGLLVGLPVLLQLATMAAALAAMSHNQPSPALVLGWLGGSLAIAVLLLGGLTSWLRAIGLGLQPLLPATRPAPARWFRAASRVPLLYLLALLGLTVAGMAREQMPPPEAAVTVLPLLLVPHLLAMACLLYCLYFAARTLRTAELGRAAALSDFAGEFFLLWFYPVGIWVVQPRLSALATRLPAA